jgi:hypothetical protein
LLTSRDFTTRGLYIRSGKNVNTARAFDDITSMRLGVMFAVFVGCAAGEVAGNETQPAAAAESEARRAEPKVSLTLVPTGPGTGAEQVSSFTTGATPLTFTATAPRGTRLVVWGSLYRDGVIAKDFCMRRVHRFDRSGTASITLDFDWTPKPGNVMHRYTIDVAGARSAAAHVNPQHPVAVVDRGAGANPAVPATDYVLFYSISDGEQAGGFSDIAEGIAMHDQAIVIRARFVAARDELSASPSACR